MTRTALYPGTFDPITNGHIDILAGALALADRVVVAIGVHPAKAPPFSLKLCLAGIAERIGLKQAAERFPPTGLPKAGLVGTPCLPRAR